MNDRYYIDKLTYEVGVELAKNIDLKNNFKNKTNDRFKKQPPIAPNRS